MGTVSVFKKLNRKAEVDVRVSKDIPPLTDAEVSIFMCRLQGAMYENDEDKIEEILKEVRIRYKELKDGGYYSE